MTWPLWKVFAVVYAAMLVPVLLISALSHHAEPLLGWFFAALVTGVCVAFCEWLER